MNIEFDKEYLHDLYFKGKTSDKSDLVPSSPIHPGEIVKDELEARGISQRKFASIIGALTRCSMRFLIVSAL